MNNQRVFAATFENTAIGASAAPIMEIQVPANVIVEILRCWISAEVGATPTDEVVAIAIYGDATAGTGGTAMTEQALTPAGAQGASDVTALLEPTNAAVDNILYSDAFHLANGWLYLPVPEERIVTIGGNAEPGDNIGLEVSVAAAGDVNLSGGMIWNEIAAT